MLFAKTHAELNRKKLCLSRLFPLLFLPNSFMLCRCLPFPQTFPLRILLLMLHSASTFGAAPAPRAMTETVNHELSPSPTHKPSLSSGSYCLSLPAIFLFCQCCSCDSNMDFVCLSHHRQPGWHRKMPFHQKKGACRETKRLCREANNTTSLTLLPESLPLTLKA